MNCFFGWNIKKRGKYTTALLQRTLKKKHFEKKNDQSALILAQSQCTLILFNVR